MRHGLARLLARVEDDTVTAIADTLRRRHPVRLGDDLAEQPGVCGRERRDVGIMRLGDDEHMSRSLRVDIAERQHPVGFRDPGRGNFPGGDGAEQAVSHTKILRLLEALTGDSGFSGPSGAEPGPGEHAHWSGIPLIRSYSGHMEVRPSYHVASAR